VQRFRDGLVFKAHRLLYHSTLGLRVIKEKKKKRVWGYLDCKVMRLKKYEVMSLNNFPEKIDFGGG